MASSEASGSHPFLRKRKPSARRIRAILDYNSQTGVFRWRVQASQKAAGSIAGYADKSGRVTIRINRRLYQAAVLAVVIITGKWPKGDVDHRDLNPGNNCWDNLRPTTHAQNSMNQRMRRNNKSGFKGVVRHSSGRFAAFIKRNYQSKYLGLYDTPELAHAAYCKAALVEFGEYARYS